MINVQMGISIIHIAKVYQIGVMNFFVIIIQLLLIQECLCNVSGSKTDTCNERGQCECNCNVVGAKCDECGYEFYKFPDCHGNHLIFQIVVLKITII